MEAQTATLQILLFGRARRVFGPHLQQFSGPPKIVPLLAQLLLCRGPIGRDALSFSLWPDISESEARSNLRRHLHRLRRDLPPSALGKEPWLKIDTTTVAWNFDCGAFIDVIAFEEATLGGKLEEAATYYTGDFLEEFYDDWIIAERERLRETHVQNLIKLVLQKRSQRDCQTAIGYAQSIIALDPWREDAVRSLIALRNEIGDRAGALVTYEQFARRLREELSTDPMPETIATYEAVFRNSSDVEIDLERVAPLAGAPRFNLPFVGRQEPMRELLSLWDRAASGKGNAVFLSGEAGIGKSRLVTEIALQAEAQGARTFTGFTSTVETQPYQPILDALRNGMPMLLSAHIDPLWLGVLATVIPEIRARDPALPEAAVIEGDHAKARLFAAFTQTLKGVSIKRPLLLIVEDIHWAGAATLGLIEHIIRNIAELPTLLVATFREEEVDRGGPLRALRRRIMAEAAARHIPLAPLEQADVARVTNSVFGKDVARSMATDLYAYSEGNPFFLAEGILEHQETGRSLIEQKPASTSLIATRWERLSDIARSVAEAAAVIGRGFDLELLREMLEWREADLLCGLDELLDHQLIREASSHQRFDYAFSHHLLQTALYDRVPANRRTQRHRRLARALEELRADRVDEFSAEIARHHDAAGEKERAAQFYLRAARHAVSVYANEEALSLAEYGRRVVGSDELRFELLALSANIKVAGGMSESHKADLEEMRAIAEALDDDVMRSETLRNSCWALYQNGSARQLLVDAEQLLRIGVVKNDNTCVAAGYYWKAHHEYLRGDHRAAIELVAQATDVFGKCGDIHSQVLAHCFAGEVELAAGEFARADVQADRAAELCEGAPGYERVRVLQLRERSAFLRHNFERSLTINVELLDLAKRIGDREAEGSVYAKIAAADGRLFRLHDAYENFAYAREIYQSLGNKRGQAAVQMNVGVLQLAVGDISNAMLHYRNAEHIFGKIADLRGQLIAANNIAVAHLYLEQFQEARAQGLRSLHFGNRLKVPALRAYALAAIGAAERELGLCESAIGRMEECVKIGLDAERSTDFIADLSELAVTYVRCRDYERASKTIDVFLAQKKDDIELVMFPQLFMLQASSVLKALSRGEEASHWLALAKQTLAKRLERLPDTNARTLYLQLPFNRALA
ncbi:MAG: AAA family ATPase [Candidatus Eremiobacteraeota bacterium]|nr:AAA family ATPase [Candidatus Eremiobacteraeota bacterium]